MTLVLTVDGVVLEEVDEVVDVHEGVVDGHDLSVFAGGCCSEGKSSDSAEAVDSESHY